MLDVGRRFTPYIEWNKGFTPPVDLNIFIRLHGFVLDADRKDLPNANSEESPTQCGEIADDGQAPIGASLVQNFVSTAINRPSTPVPSLANLK